MVLYQLEQTLGNFVRTEKKDPTELPASTVAQIKQREEKAKRSFDGSTTSNIVAATYLEEVLSMAQATVKGQPEEEHLKRLRDLFNVLEVFNIRNAISHPNRPFHPSYWHRVAAIATDPLIDKLQFLEVTQAFVEAEAGRLSTPPDEWLKEPIWSIPNNLPQHFEHDITGLKGRKKELSEIIKEIANERNLLIALVAPGGLGKTALILQALREIVSSPESAAWVDQILYFSSKTEVLTSDGIVTQIAPAVSIEGLRDCIAQALGEEEGIPELTFDEVCQKFKTKRILLCLDNLETILKDDPKIFDSFYRNLPREWRVIVTSRIDVNSATRIKLNPLDNNGSQELARTYLSKSSGKRISEDELKNLVQACDSIPIAIRLTIDGFNAGKPLIQAQTVAKEQVLEFAYQNLINALSRVSLEVLECLFETPVLSRPKACDLLQRNDDEIAEAFSQLGVTSLVTRIPDQAEESYTLSSTVRDYLLVHPIDLGVRTSVREQLQKANQTLIEIRNQRSTQKTNPLSRTYVPESAPDHVQVIAADAFRELFRPSSSFDRYRLSESLNKVKQAINAYKDQSVLHRIRGLILLKLHDRLEGKRALLQAWQMEPPDLASGLVLSNERRIDRELVEAKTVAEGLVKLGWGNPELSDAYHASLVIKNYWIPLIWLGETEQVIEDTKNWQNVGDMRGTYGLLRSQALRGSADLYGHTGNVKKLSEAVDVLSQVFDLEGYVGAYVDEGMKLLKELAYATINNHRLSEDAKLKFTDFVDKHLTRMCQVHDDYKLDHSDVRKWVKDLSMLSIKEGNNPLNSDRWQNLIEVSNVVAVEPDREQDGSWLLVRVYYIPSPNSKGEDKGFLFAEDLNKQQYHVHRNNFSRLDRQYWTEIKIGDRLQVLPAIVGEDSRAIKVHKARFYKR